MMDDLFSQPTNTLLGTGVLDKMLTSVDAKHNVGYTLELSGKLIPLNEWIGKSLKFVFDGTIRCSHCGAPTPKSYQGLCYEHFLTLAQADSCMMSPEKCHLSQGTCREPEWAERVCQQPHYVYLANSSEIKVGITRIGQVPVRWLDQGATQGLVIARVSSRYLSGLFEVILKQQVSDKTNWRNMLKAQATVEDMAAHRDRLFTACEKPLQDLVAQYGHQHVQMIRQGESFEFQYPVDVYPEKVTSVSFDKQSEIGGQLLGIKGQYLIFDQGVVNIRRHTGYQVQLFASH